MDVFPNILDIKEARVPSWVDGTVLLFHIIQLMSADINTIVLTWLTIL